MKEVRLGIVGAGWMASMLCDAVALTDAVKLQSVYTRRYEQAKVFSEKYEIPCCTDRFDDLLDDPGIDAIYVATTNESHLKFAEQALYAGKAVLLEKPFTLNHRQAHALVKLAKKQNLLIMEAMWSRFIPGMLMVRELLKNGSIGQLKSIKMQTGCVLTPEKNPRVYDLSKGGGALVDIGMYPISILEMLTERLPLLVENHMKRHAGSGVDVRDEISMRFEDGLQAEILVDCESQLESTLLVEGTQGSLAVPDLSCARSCVLTQNGKSRFYDLSGEKYRYLYQLEHFARCVAEGATESFIMTHEGTLRTMLLMDQCRAAADYRFPGE